MKRSKKEEDKKTGIIEDGNEEAKEGKEERIERKTKRREEKGGREG